MATLASRCTPYCVRDLFWDGVVAVELPVPRSERMTGGTGWGWDGAIRQVEQADDVWATTPRGADFRRQAYWHGYGVDESVKMYGAWVAEPP